MRPTLSPAGRLLLWAAFAFVAVGAIHALWPLVLLGGLVASALGVAYVAFFPTAVLLRERRLEMAWWVSPADPSGTRGALLPGRPFDVRVLLRNRSPRAMGDATLTVVASRALSAEDAVRMSVPPLSEAESLVELTPLAAGVWHLHGARLALSDRLGLFVIHAYFPNPLPCTVLPRLWLTPRLPSLTRRSAPLHERGGQHRLRLRGMAGELREIRDHAPGDPFKQIAWKATARTRRLMVRELERDIVQTHEILLDASPTMRAGPLGRAKIDSAIELCAALARAAIDTGDRVGLVAFDRRISGRVQPASGRTREGRLVQQLLDIRRIVDEDLTLPTDGELCAMVARYLHHQEGLDLRIPRAPDLEDPRWSDLVTGPHGELYDLDALDRIVSVFLSAARDKGVLEKAGALPRVQASTAAMARLRLFCRHRGLEIPYRRSVGGKARGFAEALRAASRPRGSLVLVVVSDLEGLGDGFDAVLSAARAAAQRHRLLFLVPFTPAFADIPEDEHARRAADILGRAELRQLEGPRRAIESLGIPVLLFEPDTPPHAVLGAWQRLRSRRAGGQRGGLAA